MVRQVKSFAWAGTLAALALASVAARAESNPHVRISTNMGDFVIEVLPDRAPLTAANFLRYVREGHYNDTLIHRVITNFVIQGGGFTPSDYKVKPTHEAIVNESGNGLQNKRGAVGLARGEAAHSGNCQFYVDLADNPDLDPLPTRWGYAVFGKVIQGMDVIDKMAVAPTGAVGPFKTDSPLKPIIIQKAEIIDASAVAPADKPAAVAAPTTPVQSPK